MKLLIDSDKLPKVTINLYFLALWNLWCGVMSKLSFVGFILSFGIFQLRFMQLSEF